MRSAAWIALLAIAFSAAGLASAQSCDWRPEVTATVQVREFTVRRTTVRSDSGCVQVLRGKTALFTLREGSRYELTNGWEKANPQIVPGTDITGQGKPNLVVAEFTGGAHCCTILHVVELGTVVREIAAVDFMDSENPHFEHVEADGVWEMVGEDWTFAHWKASFADSPAPRVVLRFDGKRYRLALDRMHKADISAAQVQKIVQEVRKEYVRWGGPRAPLWAAMLDAIYTGNGAVASALVSAFWPKGGREKETIVREFCAQLSTSPWFADLIPYLKDSPCEGTRPAKNRPRI